MEDILMVKDFSDVSPNDLPKPPLDREIKFKISLVLGATFISKAPYRIAPTELKELKV